MSWRDEDTDLHLTVRVAADQVERIKRRFAGGGDAAHPRAGWPADR